MTTPPRRTDTHAIVAALITALTALCVGCSTPGQFTQEEAMDAQAELAARPTSEDMVTRYDQMLQRIRDRLDTELGPFTWFEARPRSESTCGFDFPARLGGRIVSSPIWAFQANIPDDQWPHAQRIVADVTAEFGFTTMGAQIDAPGRHIAHGFDTTLGAHYALGTDVNTTLQVTTGCHLPANASPTS